MVAPAYIPDDFDVGIVDDNSSLKPELLEALREGVWRKAKAEPLWFLDKFWQVQDPLTMTWVPFTLRDYQVEDGEWMIDEMDKSRTRNLVLKARQIGWTTLGCGIAFHNVFFHENRPWMIASKSEDDAEDALLTRTKYPYMRLPLWVRERGPSRTTDNMEELAFDNGSRILAIPATSSSGRSRVNYGVLYDEAAFVEDAAEMYASLDQGCYGPMFVFSTANGMGNWFHGRWLESNLHDSEWSSRFRPWHVVPHRGPLRRDEDGKWTSDWYETERRKNRGQEWIFYQENPGSPEEAFAKSGRTVMNIELTEMEMDFRPPHTVYDLLMDETFSDPLDGPQDLAHELWVWEEPHVRRDEHGRVLQDPNYVMACDVAEGLHSGDYTSIDIFNANTGEQVASYLGHWPVEDLGELLLRLAKRYYIPLSLTERNAPGILPITDMQRAQYPRMWRMKPLAAQRRGDDTPRYGWNTNKSTKPKMIHELIRAIMNRDIMLHDERFLMQARTFIHDKKGGMNASEGNYDDKIISTAMAYQGVEHVGEYPVYWYDDSVKPTTFGDVLGVAARAKQPKSNMSIPIGRDRRDDSVRESFLV